MTLKKKNTLDKKSLVSKKKNNLKKTFKRIRKKGL